MKQRTVIIRGKKVKQDPDSKWAKLARLARGHWSNVDLGKKVGVSTWSIWCWTHGVIKPSERHQKKLRKLAGRP